MRFGPAVRSLAARLGAFSGRPLAARLGAAAAGGVLSTAFAPLEWSDAAWVGVAPLLILCARERLRGGAILGFCFGLGFWLPALAWLLRLHETGMPPPPLPAVALAWVALAAACALFLAAFGGCAAVLLRHVAAAPAWRRTLCVPALALVWVGGECARGSWFTGFPWNALGVSQHANLPLVQVAALGGVPALSALILAVNAAVALTVLRHMGSRRVGSRTRLHPELLLALVALALALRWGFSALRAWDAQPVTGSVRVVAVQPNIVQGQKWTAEYEEEIYDRMRWLTELARFSRPDLVVWPETAIPGLLDDEVNAVFLADVAGEGPPLLTGVMTLEDGKGEPSLRNSAVLLQPDAPPQQYDKVHLVPFGEYVPFGKWLRRVADVDPLGWSCDPGAEMTVFRLGTAGGERPPVRFSVLICFEDVFPELARLAVQRGAQFLVNITNDAWYDHSAGARQHLAHAVLRSVENRTAMLRVANTGISCLIHPSGRVTALGADGDALQYEVAAVPFAIPVQAVGRVHSLASPAVHAGLAWAAVAAFLLAAALDRTEDSGVRRRGDPFRTDA